MMNDADNEALKQKAWEKVLRGEPLEPDECDDEEVKTAETLRGILLWRESNKQSDIDELAREKQWRKLQTQVAFLDEEVVTNDLSANNHAAKENKHSWLNVKNISAIAASMLVASIGVKLWHEQSTPQTLPGLDGDEQVWIEKGIPKQTGKSFEGIGEVIYTRVYVEDPVNYANTLYQQLFDAGFQLNPKKQKGEHTFISLRVKGNISENMQTLLNQYNIKLNDDQEAYLRIVPKE